MAADSSKTGVTKLFSAVTHLIIHGGSQCNAPCNAAVPYGDNSNAVDGFGEVLNPLF